MFSLESPHPGNSDKYMESTIFNTKKENHPKLSFSCSNGIFSKELKNKFETDVVNEPSVLEALKVSCKTLHIC